MAMVLWAWPPPCDSQCRYGLCIRPKYHRFCMALDWLRIRLRANRLTQFRHDALVRRRQKAKETGRESDLGDKLLLLMLIAGSGGHTTELMNMMYDTPLKGSHIHRAWVVTAGDQRSEHEIAKFENWLQSQYPEPGTYEVCNIPRARRVHQQWLTVPFSVLECLRSVYSILTATYSHPTAGYRYPNTIVTTGPGTGFIVSLGGWLLKILGLIPATRCQVVYIESIARVQTLSLTGKLFYYTNIADRFLVQHEKLGMKYRLEVKPYLAARGHLPGSEIQSTSPPEFEPANP